MKRLAIVLAVLTLAGCAASSKYQRELDQEDAILKTWDKAGR